MFDSWFRPRQQTVLDWLQTLHRHPETGFEEHETAAFVAKTLLSFGIEVETGIGGTGVVGTLVGSKGAGRRIGLRAELDALPMTEESGLPYASEIPDRFHGCGHDGHMVTLLTAAQYLSENRNFTGTVHFIFQPAEELLTGAAAMIADGLLERFPCDEVYALHNLPGMGLGQVGIPESVALSSSDNIDIVIHAKGTHGSAPQTGQDAVLAAAMLITSIQQATTRVIDARETGVISFGAIHGGTARNILPERLDLSGTMRTYDVAVRDRLARVIEDCCRATESIYGVRIECSVQSMVPAALNNSETNDAVYASAERIVGAQNVMAKARPIMASEDFSLLQARVPGTYFFVGNTGQYPHHPAFVFDPSIISVGAGVFVDLVNTRGQLVNTAPKV